MPHLSVFSPQKQKWKKRVHFSNKWIENYYQNSYTRPDQKVGIYIDSSETIPEMWSHGAGCYRWILE